MCGTRTILIVTLVPARYCYMYGTRTILIVTLVQYMYEMLHLFVSRSIQNSGFAKNTCVYSGTDNSVPALLYLRFLNTALQNTTLIIFRV
jgi:hypothetical protein